MKKVFVLAIASASLIACNDNQSPSINDDTRDTSTTVVTEPPAATTTAYMPAEGDVSYRDKDVMVYRNGAWVKADDDVKLDDGIIVYKDGKVKKDNDVVVLEDGEIVTRDGNFFDRSGQKIENAWKDTKEGVKEGTKETGNAIEKGAEKVKDKAHDAVENEHDEDKK
jgi:hypothetical protein